MTSRGIIAILFSIGLIGLHLLYKDQNTSPIGFFVDGLSYAIMYSEASQWMLTAFLYCLRCGCDEHQNVYQIPS
jgi:hypothetical protein